MRTLRTCLFSAPHEDDDMIQRYHAYGTYAGDDGTFVDYNDHAAALAAKDAEIERLRTGDTCARACEGMAFRIMYQQEKARAERAEAEAAGLRADAERWRAVSAMMTHEHRGDAVGWTLSLVLPGDDPDAAIDATLTQEDHND